MIKCHLSRFMGEYKMNATDVARATGIHRIMIGQLYRETATRIDLRELEALCTLFNCSIGEMLELTSVGPRKPPQRARRSVKSAPSRPPRARKLA